MKHCDDSERRGHEALPQGFYDLLGWKGHVLSAHMTWVANEDASSG
jgi:hypothetical protein